MTSIINKSKENATINKTVKGGTVTIEVVGSKKQTVRPIMTVEARDVLNSFHEATGIESRSEAILTLSSLIDQHSFLTRERETLLSEKEGDKFEAAALSAMVSLRERDIKQWKLIAWSITAACVALIATMMISGV